MDTKQKAKEIAREKWGPVSKTRKVEDDIWFFDCREHGGYVVNINKQSFPKNIDISNFIEERKQVKFGVFEEDRDFMILEYYLLGREQLEDKIEKYHSDLK